MHVIRKYFYISLSVFFLVTSLNAQIVWSRKKQSISEYPRYVKPQSEWGNTTNNSEFDPVLRERMQFALDSTMASYHIIGASASLIMPGKGIWNGAYGMSDPFAGDSIRSDMLFGIGSCTKMYVATVVLKLAEEGLLSLDDSLYQWLPAY